MLILRISGAKILKSFGKPKSFRYDIRIRYWIPPPQLKRKNANLYSFHHGESFFPSWGMFLSTMVERKNLRGGKNKLSQGNGLISGKEEGSYRQGSSKG